MFKTTIDMFKTNNFANRGEGGVVVLGRTSVELYTNERN